jgi:hypothetical protein
VRAVSRASIASVHADPFAEFAGAAAFKKAIGRQAARARNGGRPLFSAAGKSPALHRETK